jgi:beta-N-acetylhexosaminidase
MWMWEASRPARLGTVAALSLTLVACGQGPGSSSARTANGARATPTALYQADTAFNRMTDEQRVGQLFMVGLSSSDGGPGTALGAIGSLHVGNVLLYGPGWSSAQLVRATTATLQAMATPAATAGVRLYIAGHQEGGQRGAYQAFYGPGFQSIPAALDQGGMDPAVLQARALTWGHELAAAGVNLNLAPAMDTVPPGSDASNQSIGVHRREFGHDPATVASHGAAFVRGMEAGGVSVAETHFPGLGRVPGDAATAATGITDTVTTRGDAYLQPYQAGWEAGAQMVMISMANYPGMDPGSPAVFSSVVISQVLRGDLDFGGIVISDDLGAAAAVQSAPLGERATRFLGAGGDVVLTSRASDVAPMAAAVLALMHGDPAFQSQVTASVHRVLQAKLEAGLLS